MKKTRILILAAIFLFSGCQTRKESSELAGHTIKTGEQKCASKILERINYGNYTIVEAARELSDLYVEGQTESKQHWRRFYDNHYIGKTVKIERKSAKMVELTYYTDTTLFTGKIKEEGRTEIISTQAFTESQWKIGIVAFGPMGGPVPSYLTVSSEAVCNDHGVENKFKMHRAIGHIRSEFTRFIRLVDNFPEDLIVASAYTYNGSITGDYFRLRKVD